MKKLAHVLVFAGIVVLSSGFLSSDKVNEKACWGQAAAVFARMGYMGEHASQQLHPRDGLRNLARELAELGVIPDDSMESLGAFVAEAYGLSIDACQ